MVRDSKKYKRSYTQPKIYSAKRKKDGGNSFDFKKINFRFATIIFIILFALYTFLFSGYFTIDEVIVEGNELVSIEQILNSVDLKKNIFFFNNDYYEKLISNEVPEIKQVLIFKGIPNAIKIEVLEYEKSFLWKSAGKYYLVSSQGYAYKDVTNNFSDFENLPMLEDYAAIEVEDNQQVVGPSFVAFITNIDEQIEEITNIKPGKFSITETTVDVFLETDKGFFIKFDSMRSSKKQLDNLKKVMVEKGDQIHEYVDLRIDGWAYYK